ncbi:MAG TPA: hypothetical protein VEC15_04230 [Actinomycetota bacterium]|jgi:hypothetical protein|nr:hypothetical protein [Actinomycetota bacterium]
MGCLGVLLALLTPRFVVVVVWLFSDYLNRAFESGWWPVLGFVFLPTTTIAFAVARNSFTTPGGGLEAFGVIAIAIGVALDLGLLGGSGRGIGKRR